MKHLIIPGILFFLFSTMNLSAQWVLMSNGMGNVTVYSFAVNGNNVFAGTYKDTTNSGVYLSSNNGAMWTQTGLNNQQILSLAVNGNYIFAGTGGGSGVYLSTNNGTNWSQTSLNNRIIYSLLVNVNNIYAGTFFDGVYRSTNNGTTWIQAGLNSQIVNALAANGNNIYAGTFSNGVYKSTDNGTTWNQTSLNNRSISSFAVNGSNIFAGSNDYPNTYGVYISTDNGTTWNQTSLNDQIVYSLAVNGNNVFAGTSNATSFYVSNDNGVTWIQRNEGLNNAAVNTICILNNYIFAGTLFGDGGGVYRRPLSELIGIQSISSEIPDEYSLSQNYPNPFNPTTNVKFQIPRLRNGQANEEFVRLIVIDVLGREVANLVNEQLNAGTYEVDWNASNFPSGVYFYKLITQEFSQTKKMTLIK